MYEGFLIADPVLQNRLFALLERRMTEMAIEMGKTRCKLQLYVNANNDLQKQRYAAHGYQPVRVFNSMMIEMKELPPSLFYAAECPRIALGVDSESLTGAVHLYERAGMSVIRQDLRMEKSIAL